MASDPRRFADGEGLTEYAKIGPIEVALHEKKRVEIPRWAGVVAIVAGGGLLYLGGRR